MKTTKIILSSILGLTVITGISQGVSANKEIELNKQLVNSNNQATHMPKYTQVWGQVAEKKDGQIHIKNSSNVNKDIILNVSQETIIIDAVSGLPVLLKDVDLDQGIYAYIGQAMTMSLPPMTNAKAIVVNIPQDFKAPSYVEVQSLKKNKDGSITITSEDGALEATIDKNTTVSPYLTRNIVTIDDIKVGSYLFLWEKVNVDPNGVQTLELPQKVNISKCVILPSESGNISAETTVTEATKWVKENNSWYYFKDGAKVKGWIKDNNKWYYLNNEGVMQTGWIKDNGSWYYLNANGDMAYNTTIDGYKLAENGAWI